MQRRGREKELCSIGMVGVVVDCDADAMDGTRSSAHRAAKEWERGSVAGGGECGADGGEAKGCGSGGGEGEGGGGEGGGDGSGGESQCGGSYAS